jgi:CRP/FNR family transcriptional regulator, cyclic AMP receptor protein
MRHASVLPARLNRVSIAMPTKDAPGRLASEADMRALRRIALFAPLADSDLETLCSAASPQSYRRRALITGPEQVTTHCFAITQGTARAYGLSTKGQEVTLEKLAAGTIYGLVLLEPSVTWSAFLEATADGTIVYRIPLTSIEELCLSRPPFALSVVQLLSRRLADARARIEDFALHDSRARLAHALAQLASENPRRMVPETHQELAWMIGTRSEEVTKLLRQLRREGLVGYSAEHPALVVLDIDRLVSYGS